MEQFRRLQEEADKAALEATTNASAEGRVAAHSLAEESQWTVNARKRKRVKEKEGFKDVKLRKFSTSDTSVQETVPGLITSATDGISGHHKVEVPSDTVSKPAISRPRRHSESLTKRSTTEDVNISVTKNITPSLGLAGYSSDED